MSLRSDRLLRYPDERQLKDMDFDELLRRARSGTLRTVDAPLELMRWRGYLEGEAQDLIRSAVEENRALGKAEDRRVAQVFEEVKELGVVIEELIAARRKELSDPSNLMPLSPKY
jgi:hypothetical protein